MPAPGGISIDVQDQLLKERPRKRRPGTTIYPVQHSKDLLLYDNWNNMFLTSLCRGLTMHSFESPPARVLDLGCGDGLWLIEAAKTWQDTMFVGFDMRTSQPDLSRPELGMPDVAARVSWVHGNLLETLPFPAGYFDFVRICSIGLGVPEDEWQYLLEDVSRIMTSGGVVEIIEEDLIFPCGQTFHREELSRSVTSQPGYASSSTLSYSSTHSGPSDNHPVSTIASHPVAHSLDTTYYHSLTPDIEQLLDPQDHTKLKMAWQEMLHRNFLTPRLLSVLYFYLQSSFRDIKTHPTLHVALPANSHPEDSGYTSASSYHFDDTSPDLSTLYLDLKSKGMRLSSDSRGEASSMRSRASTSATVTSYASLHLARTVHIIRGCKEAIWEEYKDIKGFDGHAMKSRVIHVREEFEAAWANWENDMKDRMGMRNKLQEHLAWMSPPSSDRPDWRVWRERTREAAFSESDSYAGAPNVCRSLRGFVGWKP